jgi:hypothetical protein
VEKTTVYLTTKQKQAVARQARRRGISEAQVIRQAISDATESARPRPTSGLFASGMSIADDLDRHLVGFGER